MVMKKESLPFGGDMGMQVAFCDGLAIEMSQLKKLIWVSGQLATGEHGQILGKGDIKVQTERCISNIDKALNVLGGTLEDVVQVTVFVKDIKDLRSIHEVRLKYFKHPYPTSTLVEVNEFVHPDALIEINAVAAV
jgi:2-iminobutanoate/2-iminopropanoate deaminase